MRRPAGAPHHTLAAEAVHVRSRISAENGTPAVAALARQIGNPVADPPVATMAVRCSATSARAEGFGGRTHCPSAVAAVGEPVQIVLRWYQKADEDPGHTGSRGASHGLAMSRFGEHD